MRLQKYLAECGVASRRSAEKLIEAGRVQVNGEAARLGATVDPQADAISVDGRTIRRDEKIYVLLNKPAGVITSARDTHRRKTVLDCIEGVQARLFPVGRLDQDTEGLLLLTNDGELAYRLTHPRFGVAKVYVAEVDGRMRGDSARILEQGVELEDGPARAESCRILEVAAKTSRVRIVLREGRKREVKRLCLHVGHRVRALKRTSLGPLQLAGLQLGEWRHLNDNEVEELYRLTGLSD
jgi:pseudouridine synthase